MCHWLVLNIGQMIAVGIALSSEMQGVGQLRHGTSCWAGWKLGNCLNLKYDRPDSLDAVFPWVKSSHEIPDNFKQRPILQLRRVLHQPSWGCLKHHPDTEKASKDKCQERFHWELSKVQKQIQSFRHLWLTLTCGLWGWLSERVFFTVMVLTGWKMWPWKQTPWGPGCLRVCLMCYHAGSLTLHFTYIFVAM